MNVFNNEIIDTKHLESIEIDRKQNEVEYGDVFFTTSSETPGEVGMSSIWLETLPNIYLNSFCFGYRLYSKEYIDYLYLTYFFRSRFFRSRIETLAQGISRYNISKTKVIELPILLPSRREQRKIGALFNKIQYFITLHQRKILS